MLKWTFLIIAVVTAIDVVGSLYFAENPNLLSATIGWFSGLYESGVHSFVAVTLVFYLIGEGLNNRQVFANWNPRSMPDVVDSGRRIKRFDSSVEFVVTLLAMAWLNDLWLLPASSGSNALVLSSEMMALLPWLNIALGASVLLSLYKLISPLWTRVRLLVDGVLNTYWLILLAFLLGLQAPFSIQWQGGDLWQPSQGNWQVAIGVVVAITAWDLFQNIRRLVRSPSGVRV